MTVIDVLLDLFRNEESQDELAADPAGFVDEHFPGGLTAEEVLAAMPGVCAALPPEQADALRTAYGLTGDGGSAGSGAGAGGSSGPGSASIDPQSSYPPPPAPDPSLDPIEQAIQQINHYTHVTNLTRQTFEDNDVTNIDDRDVTTDNSVNQNINAFGDVNQDFDNDVVTGDGAVAAGDNAQVNTGAGAVQAGGNITDATIATGNVGGSVTGDVSDSVVGDDNQSIIDSTVGAASFGDGDATNVNAQNANVGDGTQIVGGNGDVNANLGDGDFTQIEDSTLSESVVGGGTVQSNDVDIDADDGSAVAFGEGSNANAETQDVDIDDNYGQIQVAGDDSNQQQVEDNSINDSGNVTDSFNYDVDTTLEYTDNSVDNTNADQSDDDGLDLDVTLDAEPAETPLEAL
jgi:hypothetical protein